MSRAHVNTAFQSLVISRLSYALPAWGGFLKQHQISKINAFLSKAFKFGFAMQKQLCRIFLLMQTLFCLTVHSMLGTVCTVYFQLRRICKWCLENHIISSCPFVTIKCLKIHSLIAQCLQTVINRSAFLFVLYVYCFYFPMCRRILILNIVYILSCTV